MIRTFDTIKNVFNCAGLLFALKIVEFCLPHKLFIAEHFYSVTVYGRGIYGGRFGFDGVSIFCFFNGKKISRVERKYYYNNFEQVAANAKTPLRFMAVDDFDTSKWLVFRRFLVKQSARGVECALGSFFVELLCGEILVISLNPK